MLDVVILAAGKGTRMCSNKPKVLHTIAGKPFLQHVVDRSRELDADNIHIVVGHGADSVRAEIGSENISYVQQTEQLGTGHAVKQALPQLQADSTVLILYGDVPLIKSETLKNLVSQVGEKSLGLLTVNLDNPSGYGRIIRDQDGSVVSIIEHKDANLEQQKVKEVNTGVMAVRSQDLQRWLPQLNNNNVQKEYLLPDIIAMAKAEGMSIETAQPAEESEVLGVNNRLQQAELERIYQVNMAKDLLAQGLTLLDPARFDCRGTLKVGKDCLVDINCVFEGDVTLGDNVKIGPNCHISDAVIGDDVEIKSHTVIENAQVGNNATVGPFARLRPQAELNEGAKIGNFVEIKKAVIGKGSKVSHLSYIGDAEIGSDVNIGAGTITCNYDGVNKFKTKISDGVFVGSNTALVAPINLGENVTVGAGSVVTVDVKDNDLAVARTRQRNISGWKRPVKK
ncbi:bifunctional UDP-N-acetylglucosamine diphosphorylase/glucosamine-1-phosphate N-acetyltransferase GlmU [Agarilytica rhodophyticola]|uniref:bifunctional UDP-N-acetylglucosamine diphosphorylase/glucosamine-1-phosphate N-acetyltransferase GlmU n=1 Tax=Agarilytica rhodophyticola TaxID=1737490 RepID=UPI000B34375D|nr:bifunctional UDP-N-acetylglucosamine diphosphorylase/glucosamine-1-phosphate N-acetyltransferase GlmU [Agarilytica rhodophyticola]